MDSGTTALQRNKRLVIEHFDAFVNKRDLGTTLGAAFSNGRMEIKDIAPLADGRVVVRFEASADNTGALNDVAATGRRFTFCELHLMRFEDGKLVENWVGGLTPLMYETRQAAAMAPLLLRGEA